MRIKCAVCGATEERPSRAAEDSLFKVEYCAACLERFEEIRRSRVEGGENQEVTQ
jgi:hypothetical protein